MSSVNVKILFFAKSREIAGKKESFLLIPAHISYLALLDLIVNEFSLIDIKGNIMLAVNEEYVFDREEVQLKEGDEIAIIPPLSGGKCHDIHRVKKMEIIELICGKLDVGAIIERVKSPRCGAISVFIGTTRDNFNDLEVTRLIYEAYEPMAINAMKQICLEIRKKWENVQNIAICHRLGEVNITEESVVIAVSSPHRAESLAAVNFAIEKLKETVPIWKKEEYKGNSNPSQWKANKECMWASGE